MATSWTDAPTCAGPYWWRAPPDAPILRIVSEWPAGGFVVVDHRKSNWSDGVIDVREIGGHWYGPLVAPEDLEDADGD